MQWVRDHSQPYKVKLAYQSGDSFSFWQDSHRMFSESRKWCRQNKMMIWDDEMFCIRFTNASDLSWFLLRWS